MLFTPLVHAILLAVGFGGIAVLVLGFRRQQLWPVILLWLVPIALVLSAADGLVALLARPWPVMLMDGGSGDTLRFVVCCVLLLPPVELFYQWTVTSLSGRGLRYVPLAPEREGAGASQAR
jgi:hypothetical protein